MTNNTFFRATKPHKFPLFYFQNLIHLVCYHLEGLENVILIEVCKEQKARSPPTLNAIIQYLPPFLILFIYYFLHIQYVTLK